MIESKVLPSVCGWDPWTFRLMVVRVTAVGFPAVMEVRARYS